MCTDRYLTLPYPSCLFDVRQLVCARLQSFAFIGMRPVERSHLNLRAPMLRTATLRAMPRLELTPFCRMHCPTVTSLDTDSDRSAIDDILAPAHPWPHLRTIRLTFDSLLDCELLPWRRWDVCTPKLRELHLTTRGALFEWPFLPTLPASVTFFLSWHCGWSVIKLSVLDLNRITDALHQLPFDHRRAVHITAFHAQGLSGAHCLCVSHFLLQQPCFKIGSLEYKRTS